MPTVRFHSFRFFVVVGFFFSVKANENMLLASSQTNLFIRQTIYTNDRHQLWVNRYYYSHSYLKCVRGFVYKEYFEVRTALERRKDEQKSSVKKKKF